LAVNGHNVHETQIGVLTRNGGRRLFLVKGKRMQTRTFLAALATATMLAGIPLMTHPGFAQSASTSTTKQPQSTATTKQPTDGEAPTPIGPGSGAWKQKTQAPGDQAYNKQKTDGEAPTPIGPGSGAYKQKTDGEAPTPIGPGSGAFKQ
jgi:hypothetical protein